MSEFRHDVSQGTTSYSFHCAQRVPLEPSNRRRQDVCELLTRPLLTLRSSQMRQPTTILTCTELKGHWQMVVLVSFFQATCARLS